MTEADLVNAIRSAFDPGRPLPSGEVVEHSCEECADVATTFAEQRWPDVPATAIDMHYSSLPLLAPIAFRQFLPAYMVRGLERPDEPWGPNDVLEFTTYSLLPNEVGAWWRERVQGLTPSQAETIVAFLERVKARHHDYLGEAPPAATEYWRARLAREAAEQ